MAEKIRKIENEVRVIDDQTSTVGGGSTDQWATIKSYSNALVLASPALVVCQFTCTYEPQASYPSYGRLSIGGIIVCGGEVAGPGGPVVKTFRGIVMLPAGTYTVLIEGRTHNVVACPNTLTSCLVGVVDFQDYTANNLAYASVACPSGSETDLFNVNITLPSARTTILGAIIASIIQVQVYVGLPSMGVSSTKFVNPGVSFVGPQVKLYVNSIQVPWGEHYDTSYDDINGTCGVGYAGIKNSSLGSAINVRVTFTHSIGSSKTIYVGYSVVSSPWFLGQNLETVVSINKPQETTIFIVAEPLSDNLSRTIGVGATKALDLSLDGYRQSTGTGILEFTSMIDVYDPTLLYVIGQGLGSCICWLGVDVR